MAVSGYAVIQVNCCSLNVQQIIQVGNGSIMLWEASLRPVAVEAQTLNATDYMNIIVDQLHP